MVRLDVYPGVNFGTATASATGEGCCAAGVEQLISITNDTSFPTANLVKGAGISTSGLFHYPATITDGATTWEVASFDAGGPFSGKTTAAVVNRLPNGGGVREQLVFFISWGAIWSPTSNLLQHAYIHFLTRGLYAGFRRIYLSTQIDDVHLYTGLYSPNNTDFRISAPDLDFHAAWQADINTRLPAGSNYFVELGHNGNGNIENATARSGNNNDGLCPDNLLIQYGDQIATPLEFQKPLGTGTDQWPTTPTEFSSSLECMKLDPLFTWFLTSSNLNSYAHISHTYTHLSLNNATYSDVAKEIKFNIAWLAKSGISSASRFSNGLIPPAITGLHNGDAIKAWMDNGIKYVVGDNTRPVLMNQQNAFWPLTSTVEANGYAGLEIIPRWATTIFYNCDLPACTLLEWINTSAGSGDFNNLLLNAKTVNTLHLLGLHWDPFMFHQANLRSDVPQLTINGITKTYSLLTAWTEVIVAEMTRLTTWPLVTKKHDDIGAEFVARRTRDQCGYQLAWNYGPDGSTIAGATISSASACGSPVPVTFPGPVTSTNGGTAEQVSLFFLSRVSFESFSWFFWVWDRISLYPGNLLFLGFWFFLRSYFDSLEKDRACADSYFSNSSDLTP